MKTKLYLIILSILIFSCGTDEDTLLDNENDDNSQNELIDFENISVFAAYISTPEKNRDYTFHNQGDSGVFENPNLLTSFKSRVKIQYVDDTKQVGS